MNGRPGRLVLLLLLALASVPARAAPPEPLAALQRLDARVQTVGWRLARANAPFCRDRAKAIGLQLHDVYNYGNPIVVRQALGLRSDIAVQAVAKGSPADQAGLAANEAVAEVAGQPVAALTPAQPGDYARIASLHDRIDQALARAGKVELAILRDHAETRLAVPGEDICASRFEMITEGKRAAADGRRVVVSRSLVEFLTAEDQLAALLAHELAHNVLYHRSRLDASSRNSANVLKTEREADRLSVWLLANAGYDPGAALRFMAKWGPPHDDGIFSSPDHDRWKTRYKRIKRELARLAVARGRSAGAADWPRDFQAREPG